MIKKILSLALVAALMLGLTGTAFAVPFRLETPGLTIEIPEYITAVDISEGDICALRMDLIDTDSEIVYAISYNESLAGKWTQDLDQDQLTVIAETFIGEGNVSFLIAYPFEDVTYVYANDEAETYILLFLVMDGWVSSSSVINQASYIEDDDISLADMLLLGIEYDSLSPIPTGEAVETEEPEPAEAAEPKPTETAAEPSDEAEKPNDEAAEPLEADEDVDEESADE